MLSGALPGAFLFDLALLQSKASTLQRPLTFFRKVFVVVFVVVFAVAVVVAVAWRFPRFPLIHRAYSCSSCFHASCISCFLIRRDGEVHYFVREVHSGGPGGPPFSTGRSKNAFWEVHRTFAVIRDLHRGDIPGSPPCSGAGHTGRSTLLLPPPANNTGRSTLPGLVARPDGSLLQGGPPKTDQFGRDRFRAQQWEVRSGPPGMTAQRWTSVYEQARVDQRVWTRGMVDQRV